jgi:protein-S-isoprenylcysteine O-methyltransferase Ste14
VAAEYSWHVWAGLGFERNECVANVVVKGLYRYVRNPMYVSFATGVFGLWVLIGRANAGALWYTIGVVAACNAFVFLYEEPALRSMFRADYEEYCRNVRRWWPRLRAWEQKARAQGA